MLDSMGGAVRGLAAASLLAAGLAGPAFAQPRLPGFDSPAVGADRRVTFRVRAPEARSLVLNAPWAGDRLALERGADGIWSLTVGPVPPGIYSYTFQLDGARVLDPHNSAVKRWRGGNASLVEVPAPAPMPYDLRDVPHGAVHAHYYRSESGGAGRRLLVYTPPGYEADGGRDYPALYLLHGSGDDEAAWTEVGRANLILDNLIAAGAAEPMLVVMPNGHPVPWGRARRGLRSGNTEAFRSDLLQAAMPLVESLYRVRAGPRHTAIAGLSMGGGQALHCGAGNLDRFGWVGAFSSAAPSPEESPVMRAFLAAPARANERLGLLWIAIGRDDFLLERNRSLQAQLEEAGVRHTYLLTDGGHSWPVWRDYLARFAPLLFRD